MKKYRSQKRQNEKIQTICKKEELGSGDTSNRKHETGTGGSRLSCTAFKPDSHLAQIFVAKFLCIIKLIIIIG